MTLNSWKLGVEIKDDAAYSAGERWLTVMSPEDPDGTGLLLAPLNDADTALQAHRCATGTPAVSFTVDDCHCRDRDSRHGGVVSEPEAMGHGDIVAVFENGCGDLRKPDQHVPAGVGGWAKV